MTGVIAIGRGESSGVVDAILVVRSLLPFDFNCLSMWQTLADGRIVIKL